MSTKVTKNDKERLFTQRELEALIGERLMRERKNLEAYKTIKDILDEMMRDGVINAHSYAEAARELYERLSQSDAGNTEKDAGLLDKKEELCGKENTQDMPQEAVSEDAICEPCNDECKDATDDFPVCTENPPLPGGDADVSADAKNDRITELCELMQAYPELCIDTLLKDEGFVAYSQRYSGTLRELYEGYNSVKVALGKIGGRDESDGKRAVQETMRRLASTSFSSCSASPCSDVGFELSPLQREIARRAGLSYREYFDMLRDIPDSKKASRR